MTINWYPGHMVKAKREIAASVKLVDMTLVLLDARAPFSCRNLELEAIVRSKPIIMVLNKRDLAEARKTAGYMVRLRQEGFTAVAMDSISGKGAKEVLQAIRDSFKVQAAAMLEKGRRVRPARVMVAGVPNIGKSTFLNCMVGKKTVRTGARPGVTRGKQWVRVREDIELMDTPGLMWPRVETEEQGLKLALLDIVGENAYNNYDVVLYLLKALKELSPQTLTKKFQLNSLDKLEADLLTDISYRRGHLLKGGQPDLEKTCVTLLQDFRKGKLGGISLD